VIIIEALRAARSEYVVYFLLSAWFEILDHNGRARSLSPVIKRLPVRDAPDVHTRLQAVREELASAEGSAPRKMRTLQDAAAALGVACDKLHELAARNGARSGWIHAGPMHAPGPEQVWRWQERLFENRKLEL
jgi:hypothetical protein